MRLGELMAAVRMTPIKEREEEYGLGEAEVAVDCCGGENSARKRSVEQQEEEIRQYEAMLRAEQEEKERRQQTDAETAGQSDSDCFHTASELEFELTELQQLSVADDDRRSSLFAALPLPVAVEWVDSDEIGTAATQETCPQEEEAVVVGSTRSAQAPLSCDVDVLVAESEIELQKPNKLAWRATHHIEPTLTPTIIADDPDKQATARLEDASECALEQYQLAEQPTEVVVSDIQPELESQREDQVGGRTDSVDTACVAERSVVTDTFVAEPALSSDQALFVAGDEVVTETSTGSPSSYSAAAQLLLSPLPLSCSPPPSPSPSCAVCSSFCASLHNFPTSCDQLHRRVIQLTSAGETLQIEAEKRELLIQRLEDEQAERERETSARLQKEDEDYKSLYFAYCQLERLYNALKANLHTEAATTQIDDEDEVLEEEQTDAAVEAAVDYAAMSEEKVVPAKSPQPSLLDQLSAELEQLKIDKAAVEAQVETRVAVAVTEAVEVSSKYEQLQTEHSAQSERLAEAQGELEDMKLAQTQLAATHQLQMTEKHDHIRELNERVFSLETNNQHLTSDVESRQEQLDDLRSQLLVLDASNQQLLADLNGRHNEVQQLQAQLSDQRDTVDYAQNEKLALDQELSELHTAHNTLLAQQTRERQQFESLLVQQQQKDADMLSVIDDSIANIEQLRTQLAHRRLAFDRCHQTLLELWDEQLVRDEELYAVRVEVQQTSAELGFEAERVLAMAAQLTEADGMRAALESRLRCSEERVEELTALMATVEQDRRKDKQTHATLATQLTEADRVLEEHKQKHRELTKQLRQSDDRCVRLEGDIAMHEQKYVRVQSELQRERDERRREIERRRETETQLDQLQQHNATLEGQQEALTHSISLRPLGVTDEYETRLREKEALILRLGKTVKQMHRHIEVDVAQREAEMARTIRQMQRVFMLVIKILSKQQYSTDNDVRRLLEVLDREGAAARGVEEKAEVEVEERTT